ncbi:hypothetical protein C6A37_04045 [Desulfobacteraceae bacterium SEEP-SAG9]|nr:hypothetical protein C6A37_04045 [Desulfobacteraceae bacterium SEEP-SAG9]
MIEIRSTSLLIRASLAIFCALLLTACAHFPQKEFGPYKESFALAKEASKQIILGLLIVLEILLFHESRCHMSQYSLHKIILFLFSQKSAGRQNGCQPTPCAYFDRNPSSLVGKHSYSCTIFRRIQARNPRATAASSVNITVPVGSG